MLVIISPALIKFVEYFAAVYTVDCLFLLRFMNAFRSVHMCFVAPLFVTYVLLLLISCKGFTRIASIAIIA